MQRVRIIVSGLVQGVGFRPFVYNLARRLSLSGFVKNVDGLVEIEAQGDRLVLESFLSSIKSEAPPLAAVQSVQSSPIAPKAAEDAFSIVESTKSNHVQKVVAPDCMTCDDCLRELFDPADRRFRYPFINCTNCGPRFTIIKSLPYDRQETTMWSFPMCNQCLAEYEDPGNRRFHAQPNACFQCGPQLRWHNQDSSALDEEALRQAVAALQSGMIVAVKGLGGFHLMCDATNEKAITRLRTRKLRDRKPFALMMSDLEMVRKYCLLSASAQVQLLKPSRPILLLRKQNKTVLPDQIAPGIARLGVMLPYTPLHHLLMNGLQTPLVATSGNISQEPIAIDNDEARARLQDIADGFLDHNREIYRRYDDSIMQEADDRFVVLRRSRGLAPLPIVLPWSTDRTVLAFGPHLKNTFCLIRGNQAYLSQHIGDLENLESHEHFQQALASFTQMFDLKPDLIAHDYHPDYMSTSLALEYASRLNLPAVPVQHHHAHIAACLAEHGVSSPVIGVAFDGLGLGSDETIWGGEFFISEMAHSKRVGLLKPVPLPGGYQAIKQPWRMAVSYILALPEGDQAVFAPLFDSLSSQLGKTAIKSVKQQIEKQLNSPLTSSCGRLFDAVSALLGVCRIANFEGQAAMELESLCSERDAEAGCASAYQYDIERNADYLVINPARLFLEIWMEFSSGTPVERISLKFHHTVASMVLDTCLQIRQQHGLNIVCLSGGVFQNSVLLSLTRRLLSAHDFQVYFPCQIPINDGGISLGQAVTALALSGSY
jgi:hydrogenase maturation protein HypF